MTRRLDYHMHYVFNCSVLSLALQVASTSVYFQIVLSWPPLENRKTPAAFVESNRYSSQTFECKLPSTASAAKVGIANESKVRKSLFDKQLVTDESQEWDHARS